MNKIDGALISKLEKLSRMKLSEEENIQIEKDLNSIVSMFDTLQEVDTSNVEPLRHMSATKNILRKDEVNNELTNSQALKNAPKTDGHFIAVPKFLKPK